MTISTMTPTLELPTQLFKETITEEELPFIAMVECVVSVHGLFAEISKTFTLFNPSSRELEGELIVPLPAGSVLCKHGLDINGKMRDAVIVTKKRGRQILETEIRKGIDPGLVEKVQGNVHRIRVYPLPALGWRTVSITWVSALHIKDNRPFLHLPLGYLQDVDESTLSVELLGISGEIPEVIGGQEEICLLRKEHSWKAKTKMSRGTRVNDLSLNLAELHPEENVIVEQESGGEQFFCINIHSSTVPDLHEKWAPARIGVAWDSSGSRKETQKELELLSHLFQQWQNVTVDLLVFRDSVDKTVQRCFTIENGDGRDLLDTLRLLPCDGATNLGIFDFASLSHPDVEAWLLFTDGLNTGGMGYPDSSPVPVHTVTAQTQNNSFLLAYIAESCGGKTCNLLEDDAEKVSNNLLAAKQGFSLVDVHGCENVHVENRGGQCTVFGRLLSDKGRLRLRENRQDTDVEIFAQKAVPGENIARLWACREAEHRILLVKDNEAAADLGNRYGVVTSGTSLLVLETLEQYLEHQVEPPATEAELLEEYLTWRKKVENNANEEKSEHLESVVRDWQELVEWWKTDFTPEEVEEVEEENDTTVNCMASPALYDISEAEPEFELSVEEMEGFGGMVGGDSRNDSTGDRCQGDNLNSSLREDSTNIAIQPWSSNMEYIEALQKVSKHERYELYLKYRLEYSNSPSFYLDCGDYFLKNDMRLMGVRVLSNLLEMALENPALMRTCAYRLQQAGELSSAIWIFREIRVLRDDEPQSHRDLALILAERYQKEGQQEDLIEAMRLLWTVVEKTWQRFPEIEIIALLELNRLIWLAEKNAIQIPEEIDPRLQKKLDLDLRISLAWDADLTDVDLHVHEPKGDIANYNNQATLQGGRVSRDVRDGYGPEEYILRAATKGTYLIKAHYYHSAQQTLTGPCTVMATLFTDYARDNEKQQSMVLRLDKSGEYFVVGEVTIA